MLAVSARAWVQMETGVSWPDGTVPMVLMFGPNKTLADGTTWDLSAQLALDEWNRNMGRLQFTWTTSTGTTGAENNYVNEAFFAADAYGEAFGASTLAVTIYWSTSTRITRADVLFNSKYTWDSYRGVLRYSGTTLVPEFRRVALHEFGHVLGFDHPDQRGQFVSSVMNASISGIENLTASDKEGVATIYGPTAENPLPRPVITSQPRAQSVSEGGTALFSVGYTGSVSSFQWYKDDAAITGAKNQNYEINGVELAQAGDYTVVLTNLGGSVTSAAARLAVTAMAPPSNIYVYWGGSATEGRSQTFEAAAQGFLLSYQWYKDGVAISGATSSKYTISSLGRWDTGIYSVKVTNRAGSATSQPTSFTVLGGRPPEVFGITGGGRFALFTPVALTASYNGSEPYTFGWKHDGVALPNSNKSRLELSSATLTDAGSYEVTVTNPFGSSTSSVRLIPEPSQAPLIRSAPGDFTVSMNDYLNFSVMVSGEPFPTISWTRDGAPIAWTGSYQSITVSSPSIAGLYRATATNAGGSASTSFRISIGARPLEPYFVSSPRHLRVKAGDTAWLSQAFSESNNVTFKWYKEGMTSPISTSYSAAFMSFTAANEGNYYVEATFDGKTYRSATAEVKLRPAAETFGLTDFPSTLTVMEGGSGSIDVTYTAPAGTALTFQWARDGATLGSPTTPSFYRSAWTQTDAGDYTLKITNGADSVTTSPIKVVVLKKPLPVIRVQPPDLVVDLDGGLNLSVQADWATHYVWKRNGVVLPDSTDLQGVYRTSLSAEDLGDYTVTISNSSGSVESRVARVTATATATPVIWQPPVGFRSSEHPNPQLQVQARGTKPLTYRWKKNGVAIPGAVESRLLFGRGAGFSGSYTVVVSNPYGSAESDPAVIEDTGVFGKPIVTRHPQNTAGVIGQTAALTVAGYGDPDPTIQWRRNGVNIPGATGWKLELKNAQLSDSGSYDAVITNSVGSATTQSAQLTIGVDNGRIVALSARAQVGTGGDVLIPGFLIGGSTPKKLLLRALGPTLTGYGVQGALADPKLVLKALGSDTVIASNDDWSGSGADPTLPALFTQVGAAALTTGSKDAALVATLAPGLYTAITSGADGGKGVALLEVFDVDPAAGKLTGISTRAIVGTGSNVLIPGIVVDGPVAKKLLIRVSGPALAQYGVTGTLADPKIELKSANGTTLQLNDNWDKTDTALTGAVAQIGLGAFADGSKDAALVATLSAGLYTIVISGADGGSGVALVEVYDVP